MATASFVKFNDFAEQLLKGVHDFSTHSVKVALSNTAPNASTNTVFADITEIAAGNGYTAGGTAVGTVTLSETGGVAKVDLTDVVFTASGGAIATFRYVILYNDTPTSPADPLIGYYDIGSAVNLSDTDTYTIDFDNTNGAFDLS